MSSDKQLWASDGSMIPASAGIGKDRTVMAMVMGPQTLVLQTTGCNSSILHGELMGLILGLVLAVEPPKTAQLYSDHMNSTCLISDSKTIADQEPKLWHMNGQSYYSWIMSLVWQKQVLVNYTQGHLDGLTVPSKLNAEADPYVMSAQRGIHHILVAPSPSLCMGNYAFYHTQDGWIESNI